MTDATPVNFIPVERHWFLTWTTYGTWLPGDQRGYVGWITDESGRIVYQNRPLSPPAPPAPRLRAHAERNLKSPPIRLILAQAEALFEQFVETSTRRGWLPLAVGIMVTHLHALLGVPGDPEPEKLLGDLKAYGTRRLNRLSGRPACATWWTTGGSTRKLEDERAIPAVVHYIRRQPDPLLIWTRDDGRVV